MIKFYLILLCLIPVKSIAQNLTFSDLKHVLSESVVKSNDLIENKGYHIFETNSNDDDNQISYIWDKNGESSTTVSYLLVTWNKNNNFKMVWYQFHTLFQFNKLKSTLEQSGFKLTDSYVRLESLYYEYSSANYSVTMSKGETQYTVALTYHDDKVLSKEIIPKY